MYLQIGSPAGIRRGPGPLPRPAVSSCFLRTASTPSFPQQTNRNRSGTCSSSIVTPADSSAVPISELCIASAYN